MRPPSNPVICGPENRAYQVAEQPVWFPDDLWSICGRCNAVPPAFSLEYTWGFNKPTKVTVNPTSLPDLPRTDLCFLFDSIVLNREPIHQIGAWDNQTDWLLHAGPPLSFTTAHWAGPYFGSTHRYVDPEAPAGTPYSILGNSILNMQWFLFYGASMACITGTVPQVDADWDQSQILITPFDDTDSTTFGTGPIEDPGGDIKGWCLALMHRIITLDDPPKVVWHPYSLYQLQRDHSSSALPMFDYLGRNTWEQTFNPLDFPPHTIQTIPVGP